MAKFPTIDEFAKESARKALDEFEYKGMTIREWVELFLSGKLVEVVRCEKCKWWDTDTEYCQFWHGLRHPRHHCGEGEQKDND